MPLVIFLLPILWIATYSHFIGISRKSFSIHYQQRQALIQYFHLGYILTTNFCWLCLAIKFTHGSGTILIKLLMKQNMAQLACARLLVVGLLKPNTALRTLLYFHLDSALTLYSSSQASKTYLSSYLNSLFHFDYYWIMPCGITDYKIPTSPVKMILKITEQVQETKLRIAQQIYQTLHGFMSTFSKFCPSRS